MKIRWFSLTLALLFGSVLVVAGQVKVWQGTLDLPTYEEALPDPNPPFDQLTTNRFNYPYTLRTNLTNKRTQHKWRAIFLENEYLKCSVLPDLGGHLYTCIDKINGKPMFYANPSIKKANIGYRGAWAAFGVEYNFPVSHNWMSLSPIDFAFSRNPDGSASVTVGNIDRVYGMEWSVEMVLRPRSTVLEQRVRLYNRSDVRHRFYWWNNAGVQVWDDSRVEYPMRFAASHGFTEVQPWPVDAQGRDLSIIRNQTGGPVSVFVHGSREPFMGVWNPHTNSGTVHFADYEALPAKKIWSWSVDSDGLDWRKALSDNNSAYVELQGGLFRNQETYAFLEPRQTIRFSEYWMPVRDIGGVTRANLDGVLRLGREGSTLSVGFNADHPVPDATITVTDGHKQVWSAPTDLLPEKTFSQHVSIPDTTRKYTVEIRDRSGATLIGHTEDQYNWTPVNDIKVGPQTSHKIPLPENRTDADWIELGETQELNGRLLDALQTYSDLLKKNPASYEGLRAAGRLSAALFHYDDAVRYLEEVCRRNTTDAQAAYYLGVAYEAQGSNEKARDAFESAYRLPQWRSAAAVKLAELSGREGNLNESAQYLQSALQAAPDDIRSGEALVAVESALKKADAKALLEAWQHRFPTSYFLREEAGQTDALHLANDDSRILNIAAEYMRLGLFRNALDVLSRSYPQPLGDQSEPGSPSPASNPMLAYYRAYCHEKLGQSPTSESEAAAKLSTNYIFPNSAEDFMVLRSAIKAKPSDAHAHYLLGTLLFSKGLTDEALDEWNAARELTADIPVLDASRGIAQLHIRKDPEAALKAFTEGIHSDPRNEVVYFGADQALSMLRRSADDRVHALEQYPDRANIPPEVVYELALNLAESGQFDRASTLFHDRFFAREEGGTNVRQVWVEVQLLRALDVARRGNCDQANAIANGLGAPVQGVSFTTDGLPQFITSARTTYLLGEMSLACNTKDQADSYFSTAAKKTGTGEIIWAWLSAKHLPGFESSQWEVRLAQALQQTEGMTEASSFAGWWVFNRGMLNRALGHETEAQQDFQKVFLLPDRMLSYHLARQAMSEK